MSNSDDLNGHCQSKNGEDILEDIPDEHLPELRDIFKANWPYSSQPYFFIDNMINWKKKIANYPTRFLAPNGKWQTGTFVSIIHEFKSKIYFYTLEENPELLMKALHTTKLINWQGNFILDAHEKLIEPVMESCLPHIKQPVQKLLHGFFWWIPQEKALNFTIFCPSDVEILPLTPEMSILINSYWPEVHRYPNSENFIGTCIERNGALGVFGKENKELRAWITVNEFGALGTLQTLEEHKRKGYAALLVKQITKNRAKKGFDSVACSLQDNIAPKELFIRLGYTPLNTLRCIQFTNTIVST